ncbi:hypothetical protein KF728_02215 [Candidatus Obscuribacterales bacterium]|nr:hypothetical protein [Candidatus Obscuribacterales bacterium]
MTSRKLIRSTKIKGDYMKPFKFFILIVLAIFGLSSSCPTLAADAPKTDSKTETQLVKPKTQDTDAKVKTAKGKGKDPKIKTARALNKPADKSGNAPPSKGGAKTRSMWGGVVIDNRTGSYIDVYLDGTYTGTVGPWGDMYRDVVAGRTNVYCVAPYTDGTYDSWEYNAMIPRDISIRFPIAY